LRISRFSENEVQMHLLKQEGAAPYAKQAEDEWLIVRSGEDVLLGAYRLHVAFHDPSGSAALETVTVPDAGGH
jgi:hypothetical protein